MQLQPTQLFAAEVKEILGDGSTQFKEIRVQGGAAWTGRAVGATQKSPSKDDETIPEPVLNFVFEAQTGPTGPFMPSKTRLKSAAITARSAALTAANNH